MVRVGRESSVSILDGTHLPARGKEYAVSYLILPDGTIQVTTEQEALAIRAHLLSATPDIAALQGQLRILNEVLRACQDELGGAAPEALPGLIRKLRLMEPNDQLRIERNYWRARSMELGEEVIIWQRRAGRDAAPTTEIFADLQAKVKAACSNFAQQLEAARPASEPRAVASSAAAPADRPPPESIASQAASADREVGPELGAGDPSPRLELRQIRERLGFSQRELAAALGQTQDRISLMERGSARIALSLLAAARALESSTGQPGAAAAGAAPAAAEDAPPDSAAPAPERPPVLSDADLEELAGCPSLREDAADDSSPIEGVDL